MIWVPPEQPAPRPESNLEWLLTVPAPRRGSRTPPPARRRARPSKAPRRPASGLAGLVPLALLATFFAWVSAEPLWLALGHGDQGTAVVTRCTGNGVGQGCIGGFASADGDFRVAEVAVLDVDEPQRRAGATVTARMVSPDSRGAYAGDRRILHVRSTIGLVLVLACGLGIALATGATRLEGRRARLAAFAMSLGGPLLVVVGFLAASF